MSGFHPQIHVEHFGCRAARADGEALSERLRALSEAQPFAADVVVVNTCSVTAEADRAARAYIRRAHRQNPEARIVVTGCYAQRAPEELAGMAAVAAVVGNSHKALAPEIVLGLARGGAALEPPAASQFVSAESLFSRKDNRDEENPPLVAPPPGCVSGHGFSHAASSSKGGGALQAAEKGNRSWEKCQGTASVVPQAAQKAGGLYRPRKKTTGVGKSVRARLQSCRKRLKIKAGL